MILDSRLGEDSASRRGKIKWDRGHRNFKGRFTCAHSHAQEEASFFKDRIPLEVCKDIEVVER